MSIETISSIIAVFVGGSLGIASLMHNYRSRLCIRFAALCGVLFFYDILSLFESFSSNGQLTSPRVHTLVALGIGPLILATVGEVVPHVRARLRRMQWGLLALLILFACFSVMSVYGGVARLSFYATQLLLMVPWATALFALQSGEKEARLTRERLRLRFAFWGAVVATAVYLTDAAHFAGWHVPALGTVARSLYLMFFFQTFIQRELITAEEIVTKLTLFSGIAVMLSTIFTLLVAWVGNRPGLFFFNTFIASFVIIVLFDPIRRLATRATRRLFSGKNLALEEELNELSEDVMGMVEPADLARRMHLAFERSIGVEACSLFILDRDGLAYLRVDPKGSGDFAPEISSSAALVEYITVRKGRPFVVETIESDRDSFRAAQSRKFCESVLDMMRKWETDLVLPFADGGRIVGFCLVRTGERVALSNEQLRLFGPVGRQIAMILKNAQTFSVLRDRDKLAAVGEMAAGLAHEIKNPLGAIKGAAELLKGTPDESQGKDRADFLRIILHETDRLSGVLTDFLDYAKPRRIHPEASCDVLRVVEHTASLCLRDAKVTFEVESDEKTAMLNADPEILKQILLNLFLNALHAMDGATESPHLKVRVRELRPKRFLFASGILPFKPMVEIEVRDNGRGISEQDMARIFVPFFTTKPKGTGLGLPICQRLVEGMRGTITAKPNLPAGTIFTIHLPIPGANSREETGEGRGNIGESRRPEANT